jgi:hypothetical protein
MDTLDVLVLLDRSGSMAQMRSDHEGGLRAFIDDQKALDGNVRFTLVQFDSDDPCEIVYDRVPIRDVGAIRLNPRGSTPLLDAMGGAMAHLSADPKASHVVFMVLTDGLENASREWTRERVKARLTELERQGWTFLFLGANIDSFAEGAELGVSAGTTANFNSQSRTGTQAVYTTTASNLRRYRSAAAKGAHGAVLRENLNYTTAQTTAMRGDEETASHAKRKRD